MPDRDDRNNRKNKRSDSADDRDGWYFESHVSELDNDEHRRSGRKLPLGGWLLVIVAIYSLNAFSGLSSVLLNLATLAMGEKIELADILAMAAVLIYSFVAIQAVHRIARHQKSGRQWGQVTAIVRFILNAIVAIVLMIMVRSDRNILTQLGLNDFGEYGPTILMTACLIDMILELIICHIICRYFDESRRVERTLTE